jgi:hypothetical protein
MRAGYLNNVDWDRNREPVMSSDDEESDKDGDDEDDKLEDKDYKDEDDAKTPPPPRVSGEVFGQIYNGRVICDDIDDMIHYVIYHYFQATDRSEAYQMPPELTEEEELAIAILISEGEERRAGIRVFPELADALVLSVAPPPPPTQQRTSHSAGCATSRGQGGAMGRLARSCTRVAGGHAAYPRLGSRDADPPTRASTAAHSKLAMAVGALHRPLRRLRRRVGPAGNATTLV